MINDALKETFYCNFNHPAITDLAAHLSAAGTSDPLEVAKRSFYHVRDEIPYGLDLFRRKASETLERGYGVCWNKSLLLVALLRCNLIPAYFGSIPMRREFSKPAAGLAYLFTNNPYHHCVAHAHLNGRWIVLDTVLDQKTYDTCYRPLNVQWGIDWDGENDCRLYEEHIAGPAEMHRDIDQTIDNKVGNKEWPWIFAIMANKMINRKLWRRTGVRPKGFRKSEVIRQDNSAESPA